jgi:hypothetical protein
MKRLYIAFLAGLAFAAQAELLQIPTGRGDMTLPVYWEQADNAKGTVILLPGGEGTVKFKEGGKPKSNNFVVRTYPMWLAKGMNVMVVGTVSEAGLSYPDRVSQEHADDLAKVAAIAHQRSPAPVWLVGTSRGTVSATSAAIKYAGTKTFDGIVLTSAVVTRKVPQSVTNQDMDKVDVPVLVYMHEQDACPHCTLYDAKSTIGKFKRSPVPAFMSVTGGSGATGNPCQGQHYHGFIGMEEKAVSDLVNWIVNPVKIVSSPSS